MPKSYEEAQDERNEGEHKEGHSVDDPSRPAGEADVRFTGERLREAADEARDLTEVVPDWLQPGGRDLTEPPTRTRPGEMPDFGFEFGGFDELGMLEVIARVEIAQLAALFDIANAVEPLKGVVVSGTNSISNADTPEAVIPESDETKIASRKLYIKASEDNNKLIWFGDDEVEPESGFTLGAGESILVPIDMREDILWMASEEAGQQVELMGML